MAGKPVAASFRCGCWLWWCCVAVWPHGCSGRRRSRPPARLGILTSFGAAPRSPPVPSGPSGTLHTSGAWCARGRRPSRWAGLPVGPGCLVCPWAAARPHSNFACNSPAACSNIEFASLELQRFLGLLKVLLIELHAKFVWRWSCRHSWVPSAGRGRRGQALRHRPALQPSPAATHGHCSQAPPAQ